MSNPGYQAADLAVPIWKPFTTNEFYNDFFHFAWKVNDQQADFFMISYPLGPTLTNIFYVVYNVVCLSHTIDTINEDWPF